VYKHTERALRALTESLERRVQERTSDLEAAKADAERANRSKTRFVAAAVHDLMQPLDAARMFVSAARPHLTEKSATDMLDGIDSALAAEDEILSSLLDISRLESGMFEVQDREFALSPLLETLAREFGILASARGIELRVANCRAAVRSDETLLRRILQNFLSNALRYTLRGRILLGCRRVGDSLRIEVWDTGPGIAKADHQRIFLEFQRLDAAGDMKRGAGLGLAIVERIGKRLGHPIGLRSWPGSGSVFSVTVPLIAARANQHALPSQSKEDEGSPLRGRRICCLDDDVLVRNGVRMLLQGWGCEVMLAASGAEAIGLTERSPPPDLLLVDYRLPDGTGPDFVEHLHRRWETVIPVIIISAERDAQLRESFRRRNWAFLAKPIRPAELRALITHMLLRAELASL
jgi:histidine kinase